MMIDNDDAKEIPSRIIRVIFVNRDTGYLYSDRMLTVPFLCNTGNGHCRLHAKIDDARLIVCDMGHLTMPDFPYQLFEMPPSSSEEEEKEEEALRDLIHAVYQPWDFCLKCYQRLERCVCDKKETAKTK